jgi:uncharacterized RDD family membrane protein YckC
MQVSTGVYFRREDYAPLWLRILIDIIDLLVAGTICVALAVALYSLSLERVTPAAWVLGIFSYFVLLKRSNIGTVGYRVGRVRAVGIDGNPPSLLALTMRLLFGVLGPINWLLDLGWLSNDAHRQALRDKFAQTYVIKRNAQPAGTGKLVYRYSEICFINWLFPGN